MSKKDIMNGKTLPLASAKASSAPSAKGDATLVDVVSSRAASEARPRKRVSAPPASKAEPPVVVQPSVPPPAPSKARVSSAPKASKVSRASVPPSRASSRDLSAASLAGSGSVQRKRANRISKAPPSLASSPSVAPASAPRVEVKETLLPASPVLVTPSAPAPSSRRTGDQTLFGQTSTVPANASSTLAFDKTVAISGAIKPPTEDEISIPPASDLEEHDRFFVEGELAEKAARDQARAQALRPNGVITGEHEMVDPRLLLLASPAARARRAKYEKWVKAAVGVSAVLCLAALVRVAVARSSHDPETSALAATNEVHAIHAEPAPAAQPTPQAVQAVQAVQPVIAAQPANAAPEPAPSPQAPTAPAAPAVETTSATSPAPPIAEPSAATPPAAEAPTETAAAPISDKTAPEEKKAARIALERGKAKDAIAAGERSVALDPTDGEAWLILGAAYQEAGKGGEARRCFNACLKQAKKGPIGECRSMLQ